MPHLLELYKQGSFPIDQLATVYGTGDLELALEGLKSGKVGALLGPIALDTAEQGR